MWNREWYYWLIINLCIINTSLQAALCYKTKQGCGLSTRKSIFYRNIHCMPDFFPQNFSFQTCIHPHAWLTCMLVNILCNCTEYSSNTSCLLSYKGLGKENTSIKHIKLTMNDCSKMGLNNLKKRQISLQKKYPLTMWTCSHS